MILVRLYKMVLQYPLSKHGLLLDSQPIRYVASSHLLITSTLKPLHSQISLGVAAYGHSFDVSNSAALSSSGSSTLKLYPAFNAADQPHGDSQDAQAGTDECGNATPVGGIFNFWGLIQGGFLNTNGTAATGIDYTFDNCSQTVSFVLFHLSCPQRTYGPMS